MKRWIPRERDGLAKMKEILKDDLVTVPPYPDVVGDRRLIRFLRGRQCDIEAAVKQYREFLAWWKTNNVEEIRNNILYGGMDSPFKFPHGQTMIDLVPQIVIAPHARSNAGHVVILDCMGFDPNVVFEQLKQEDLLKYVIYTLEYRSLVLEQLAHQDEEEYKARYPTEEERREGYGTIPYLCSIRDLKGVGFQHLGAKAKALIKTTLDIAVPNYSEYMGKTFIVNAPFIFKAFWSVVKTMLDAEIIAKISLDGTNFLANMQHEIPLKYIPERIGGQMTYYNEPYEFNIDENGPLSYPGCPLRPAEGDKPPILHAPPANAMLPLPPPSVAGGGAGPDKLVSSSASTASTATATTAASTRQIGGKAAGAPSRSPGKAGAGASAAVVPLEPTYFAVPPPPPTNIPVTTPVTNLPPDLPTHARIPDGFPGRFKESEMEGIAQMRAALKSEIASLPGPFPEVVGDRRVVRFLRARNGVLSEAITLYRDFLSWYKVHNVADVRNKILYGRCNQPSKFPHAHKILAIQRQIVISGTALDKKGNPIVVETFNFNPAEVFKLITIEQYLEFLLYTLEFRTLIFEQMSENADREYLRAHPNPNTRGEDWGTLVSMCSIRDLSGLGFAHMGSQAKQMLSAGLKFGIPNYPEMLAKAHFLNVPLFFNVIWLFIKAFLDANILEKISLTTSSNSLAVLAQDVDPENIPRVIGGTFAPEDEVFVFDISASGPFYIPNGLTDYSSALCDAVTTTSMNTNASNSGRGRSSSRASANGNLGRSSGGGGGDGGGGGGGDPSYRARPLSTASVGSTASAPAHHQMNSAETKTSMLINLQARSLSKYSALTEQQMEQRLQNNGLLLRGGGGSGVRPVSAPSKSATQNSGLLVYAPDTLLEHAQQQQQIQLQQKLQQAESEPSNANTSTEIADTMSVEASPVAEVVMSPLLWILTLLVLIASAVCVAMGGIKVLYLFGLCVTISSVLGMLS